MRPFQSDHKLLRREAKTKDPLATYGAGDDALQRAVRETVSRFGGIDVAITNAGISHIGRLATAPIEQVERTIEVNPIGAWRTVSAVIEQISAGLTC